jgi:hypothetical protein
MEAVVVIMLHEGLMRKKSLEKTHWKKVQLTDADGWIESIWEVKCLLVALLIGCKHLKI